MYYIKSSLNAGNLSNTHGKKLHHTTTTWQHGNKPRKGQQSKKNCGTKAEIPRPPATYSVTKLRLPSKIPANEHIHTVTTLLNGVWSNQMEPKRELWVT